MRSLMPVAQAEDEEMLIENEDLGEATPALGTYGVKFGLRRFVLASVALSAVAAVAVAAVKSMPVGSASGRDTANVFALVDKEDTASCDTEWSSTSSADPDAKLAAENALKLVTAERTFCSPSVGAFKFTAEDFQKGDGHKHYLHVHVKSASDCKSKTYKLHFFADPSTSFVLQANQNEGTKAWTLLDANPASCLIESGSAATPQAMPVTVKPVKEAAKFAIAELNYQMTKTRDCPCVGQILLEEIKACVVSVQAGLNMNFLVDVNAAGIIKTLKLKVIERCAGSTPCIRQLSLPDKACKVWEDGDANRRLYAETMTGAHPNDPTELMVAQQQDLHASTTSRRLGSGSKPALQQRHIKTGKMPSSWDPRSHQCFQKITVYNQGSCGSCYAQAVAQMMGIRKCLVDKGGSRRLDEIATEEQDEESTLDDHAEGSIEHTQNVDDSIEDDRRLGTARVTKKGCACHKSWSLSGGSQCSKYCCNPDKSAGDWCFVKSESCEGSNWGYCKPQATPQPACADSTTWNYGGRYCSWFAKYDPTGKKYKDYGQRAHCKKLYNLCKSAVNQNTNANPWYGALYDYMPAVADIAKCAKSADGSMQGCDGGNIQGVWNNWMKDLNRKLWVMGEKCKPYDMKCKSSSGVVNPLTGGSCSAYSGYQKWHKPCSCISERPSTFQCPRYAPSASCDFPVPPGFFIVSGVSQSLSRADAVLNFQRHIHEYGPIYVSFQTTNAFMHWNWAKNPVYTGGSTVEGGHAVTAVGWGRHSNVDYWLLRNSWGSDWADKGYAKFQRGVNRDGIEDTAGASMPEAGFKDWSPPYCSLDSWSWSYNNAATVYDVTLTLTCSKKSSLKIFTSERLTNRKQIESGVKGRYTNARITYAGQTIKTAKVKCASLGFGKRKGDMWVQIASDDGKGNKGKTSHFISLPAVGRYR
mmetsp:Transcript_56226/g.97661  ORF Transcript_56226/g.97661 Transcript_56226/m.97661 type:complete len:924 (-) Transcript_56226:314-3085(-)